MILNFYRLISDIMFIPVLIYFLSRILLAKENITSVMEKFCWSEKKRPHGKLVWINAVSVGEAKTGIIIAKKLKKNNPNVVILLSTSTLTSYNLLSKDKKNDFLLIFSPLDINLIVKKFIKKWQPNLTIFIESEIWPNIFYRLNKKQIKLKLFNARISEKSFNKWSKIISFARQVFLLIDECFVQDYKSLARFKKLGVKKVKKIQNLKFLTDKLYVNENKFRTLNNDLKKKKIITLFSSHQSEEKILVECQKYLSERIQNLFFIIIPRHINRVNSIKEELKRNRVSFSISNKSFKNLKKKDFLIVNTMGELGMYFKLSDISIIGGSFSNFGGHNPIETNGFRCSLVFGPYMQNFDEIKTKIIKNNAGFQVKNTEHLILTLEKLINNKVLNIQTFKNFEKLCDLEIRKSQSVLDELLK